jgi:hypothetical protein
LTAGNGSGVKLAVLTVITPMTTSRPMPVTVIIFFSIKDSCYCCFFIDFPFFPANSAVYLAKSAQLNVRFYRNCYQRFFVFRRSLPRKCQRLTRDYGCQHAG